jgi:hypothetical protein
MISHQVVRVETDEWERAATQAKRGRAAFHKVVIPQNWSAICTHIK